MTHQELGPLSANGKDHLRWYGLIHKPDDISKAGCILYTIPDEQSKDVLKFLLANGITVHECCASSGGESLLKKEIPVLITREGEFSKLEGARAWIGWFVNDPDYQKLVADKHKPQLIT